MTLRPHPFYRLLSAVPGLLVTGFGLAIVTSRARGLGLAIAVAAIAAVGAWLLARGLRLGVVLTDQHVTVHGWLRSRQIPRTILHAVTGHPPRLPAITWIDRNGRTRATPLVMFTDTQGGSAAVKRSNTAALTELSKLVGPAATKQPL